MEALYTLYGNKIYGYDSFAQFASVFPVYFDDVGQGFARYIRYGPAIHAGQLHGETIHTNNRFIQGVWKVAGFGASHTTEEQQHQYPNTHIERHTLDSYYATLALSQDADRATVREAYRRLARLYHPDLNASPDAHTQMQRINEAYRRIMQQLEGDD
ncbi:MAG: DnaJ domain-containing protein [Anaerolineae bacterium]|nr:DnaJ domain-containing protein [Anaerolineae bacterium]